MTYKELVESLANLEQVIDSLMYDYRCGVYIIEKLIDIKDNLEGLLPDERLELND